MEEIEEKSIITQPNQEDNHQTQVEEQENAQPIKDENQENKSKELFDSSCPICLCPLETAAMIEKCFHMFCFLCILQWSQTTYEPQCPLCKRYFSSLIYDIKSEREYKKFFLENGTNKKSKQKTKSVQQTRREEREDYLKKGKRIATPKFHLPFTSEHALRRNVYARSLRAVPLVPIDANSFRQTLNKNEKILLRLLLPFLQRELQALLEEEDVELICSLIMSLFKNLELDSPAMYEQLSEYIFENTPIFIHEILCFVSSGYEMKAYDRLVRYDYSNATPTRTRFMNTANTIQIPEGTHLDLDQQNKKRKETE